ncbi:hypothetical protein EZV62_007090 [Acer yangbiense]|uniref:Uncharacterized protein n=1 Tax=Acer yangbiense TaxID=1000413 RepID=A0A5C7I9C3_9ROSI|nr:hypothetical protein EZV62_007090 [Acer yangbiense]
MVHVFTHRFKLCFFFCFFFFFRFESVADYGPQSELYIANRRIIFLIPDQEVVLEQRDAADWVYRGEGAANPVLVYTRSSRAFVNSLIQNSLSISTALQAWLFSFLINTLDLDLEPSQYVTGVIMTAIQLVVTATSRNSHLNARHAAKKGIESQYGVVCFE